MEAAWKMANLTHVPSTLSSSPSSLLTLMYVPVLTSCVVSSSLLLPHPLYSSRTFNYQYSGGSYTQNYTRLFGLPILVTVARHGTTFKTLYEAVIRQCRRYMQTPAEVKEQDEQGEGSKDMESGECESARREHCTTDTAE